MVASIFSTVFRTIIPNISVTFDTTIITFDTTSFTFDKAA